MADEIIIGASGTNPGAQVATNPAPASGNPPAVNTAQPGQAIMPSVNAGVPDEIRNNKFYQDAITGMNRAQEESAAWRKISEQYNGLTPEQAAQAIETARYIAQNPQQAFMELANQFGPQTALQMIIGAQNQGLNNQVYQGNQVQSDPVEQFLSQYTPQDQQALRGLMGAMEQRMEQKYAPVNQFVSQQQADSMISAAQTVIEKVAAMVGRSGDQQFMDSVFRYAADNRVPPHLMRSAAIEVLGGPEKLLELSKIQVLQGQLNTVNRNQQNTSSTLVQPGVSTINQPDYATMRPEDIFADAISRYKPLST